MRPQFTNAFAISKNGNSTEVIISFKQQYVDGEDEKHTPIQKIDDVASVVMSLEAALSLKDVLDKVIGVDFYPPAN